MTEKTSLSDPRTVERRKYTLNNDFSKRIDRTHAVNASWVCVIRYHRIRQEIAKRSPHPAKVSPKVEAEIQKAMRTCLARILRELPADNKLNQQLKVRKSSLRLK